MKPRSQCSRFGFSRPRWRPILTSVLALALLGGGALAALAETGPTISFESPLYAAGTVHEQDGWHAPGSAGLHGPSQLYDVAVADTTSHPTLATFPGFGSQTLRMSNAVGTGEFGHQTYSKPLANEAGETSAVSDGKSGGTRQRYFEGEFSFASAVPSAEQENLRISISPDRGDGARMSFIALNDTPDGLTVDFWYYDTELGDFVEVANIAGYLDRGLAHTVKLTMHFVDGPDNDLVQVYVDDVLRATGPSWEDYFREVENKPTRPVDSLIFMSRNNAPLVAAPGNGFFIDNLTLKTGDAPALDDLFVRVDGDDHLCDGSTDASLASAPNGACAFATIQRGVDLVAAGGTVHVGAGTYVGAAGQVTTSKSVTIQGAGRAETIIDGFDDGAKMNKRGIEFTHGVNGATVKDLTVKRFNDHGIFFGGFASAGVGPSNITVDNVESSENGAAPGTGAARGIVVWDGAKTNISITNSIVANNGLVGMEAQDGTVENGVFTGNTVTGNGDSGIGIQGPKTSLTVADNTVTNNGRYGIEIKNPDGLTSGTPTLVVNGNTVSRTVDATDARDHAGILVMRRDPFSGINVDQPAGVLIQNNVVSGFKRKPSGSTGDGFGIVVSGTNMVVRNNIVDDNDVGIQVQAGNPSINAQSTAWFDRDNAASFSGVVTQNDIRKATGAIGLRGVGAPVSNADVTQNWWGASSGPSGLGTGSGASAAVSNGATLDFTPFLGHGTDTSASIGFQPDLTPLTTAHVLPTGSDTECDGSANVAFDANLLGACAVATARQGVVNVTAPGIVSIGPGTYSETATVLPNKDDLTIRGADANNRPIIANGLLLGAHNDLTLENLIVQGADDTGSAETRVIRGGAINNFTMNNVMIDGEDVALRHGMTGHYNGNISITNSQFVDIRHWVAFDTRSGSGGPPAGADIVNGTFSNNTLTRVKGHVNFRSSQSASPTAVIQVTNNTWTETGDFNNGATASMKIFYAASATISGNTFKDAGIDPGTPPPAFFQTELQYYGAAVMPRGVINLTIQNNLFENNNQAIAVEPPNPAALPGELLSGGTIKNNTFLNNKFGVYIPSQMNPASNMAGLTITENSFVSNKEGAEAIRNLSAAPGNLPAIKNWWGNDNGPTHTTNPGGSGSVVNGKVAFSPWLADGTDTDGAIGFQPNLEPLGFLNTQGINVAPTSGLVTTENGGTASFAVVLASAPSADVQIGLSSSNTNEGTVSPSSLTFTSANWNVPQTVTVTGVAVGPSNGNVAYTIITAPAASTDPAFDGLNPADVSVTNNAAVVPSLSIADNQVEEGNTLGQITFNVTLSQASPHPVSVTYAVQGQTATVNADFLPTGGTLTFNPGETTKTIVVGVVGDTIPENPPVETFLVTLSNPSGATIADGQATGTIHDDELPASALPCGSRPDIVVETQAVGARQLQVTIKAGTATPNESNSLTQIKFGTPNNATIQLPGQANVGTSAITLPNGTKQIVFMVTQTNANAAFQVPFTINDTCGSVEKFVGGGKDAIAN